MPIEITGPDGAVVQFPDDMHEDDIASAMKQHYGGPVEAAAPQTDGSITEGAKTFGNELANTLSLNLWRNAQAGYDAYANGKDFNKAYADQKALDAARFDAHPTAGYSGIAAGLAGPVAASLATAGVATPTTVAGVTRLLPAVDGIVPAVGRALKAGAYGAGYGGVSEYADTKDSSKALTAAVNGAMMGAALNPVLERGGQKILNAVQKDAAADIGKARADKMMLDITGAKDASGNPITSRVEGPTYSTTTGEPLPGPVAPSEEAAYRAFINGLGQVGHSASKVLPWALGAAGGLGGAYHGGVGHGVVGALTGAVTGGASEALGHYVTNKLTGVGDKLIDRAVNNTREMYAKPWEKPWEVRGAGAAGLLGGTTAAEAASDPLVIRVKPNNR